MKIKTFLLTVLIAAATTAPICAAITININSGSPTMPYPRFLDYTAGGQAMLYSLANYNHQPDGVSHAEMEQWGRDAWKIHSNRFSYQGTANYFNAANGAAAVQLIYDFDGDGTECTEGDGYHLLMAALMADKSTFDGIWFWMNENNIFSNTPKYSTGAVVNPTYKYGVHVPGVYHNMGDDSAGDGDMDIAMAALIAWKQWGDNTGYYAPGGTGPENVPGNGRRAIQYKQMALDMMRFIVARKPGNNTDQYVSGDVGFDGYPKGGNTWHDATPWGNCPGASPYCPAQPDAMGAISSWYDYSGPSYFKAFADAMQLNATLTGDTTDTATLPGNWSNINQNRRAEASTAWLAGQLGAGYAVPIAGSYSVAGTTATFGNGLFAEDLRSPWRHALYYLLYGNPTTTWNPTTHQPVAGANTYERDTALKLANFLDNHGYCNQFGWTFPLHAGGAAGMVVSYNLNGTENGQHINHIYGASAPACIIRQDFPQMEDWFRELLCLWDGEGAGGDGYLTSTPRYFHEFFRTLGLMFFMGNYTDPSNWNPKPNLKIYKAVDKTYAFTGDTITYWINYRNFGSVDATGVKIYDTLPSDLTLISSSHTYINHGSNVFEWQLPDLSGLHNNTPAAYDATKRGITIVAKINDNAPTGRICNTADISCTNGLGWRTSDESNDISPTMRRNCVDIISAALMITKTANTNALNPGMTITYTIQYENSSKAGWLDGGRSGVIFSIGSVSAPPGASQLTAHYSIYSMHQAAEPMINLANYRLSVFVNSDTHGAGWEVQENLQGLAGGISFTSQDLQPGCTAGKCWNQRLIFRFGDDANPSYTLPAFHIHKFFSLNYMLHYPDPINGNAGKSLNPMWADLRIQNQNGTAQDWTDDWSYITALGDQNMRTPPISEDYTDGNPLTAGIPVFKMNKDACETEATNVTNMLIEEWDGYCWRRVYGNGPQPGRQISNVHIIDSLPADLTFGGFVTTTPPGTWTPGTRTLEWNIGNMLVNDSGYVSYWAYASGTCPMGDKIAVNTARIYGDLESPVFDSWAVTITCNYVPPPPPPPSSVTKTANVSSVSTGGNVNYTVNYTNLKGSVIDTSADSTVFASSANWTAASTMYTFSAGTIRTPSNTNTVMTYNYSHGINGTIYVKANLADSADFGIKFRNNCYLYINKSWSESAQLYNGATAMDSYSSTGGGKIPANADIKIVLNGAQVDIFVKDQAISTWSPTPLLSSGAMPATAGFAGFVHGSVAGGPTGKGNFGLHTITYFRTELDTAFNILVRDPIPNGMSFVSATNSGVVNTTPNPDEVQWPIITQLNYGQSISYSWTAQATGSVCGPVVNIAYVEPRGVTYTVADQVSVTVNCGATTPTFTPSRTRTSTNTPSPTPSPSPSPSGTGTRTATPSYSPSGTPTRTPTPSPSPTGSGTVTFTQTRTGTATLTLTPTGSASFTPTATGTRTNTPSASATPSGTPTATPTRTATLTFTRTATQTITDTISSNTPTITRTITWTPTATLTFTSTGTASSTPTGTGTRTATQTATPTRTDTPANTATHTPTATMTSTPTPTVTDTNTPLPTVSFTDTISSNTPTVTRTSSDTPTHTPTATGTPTGTTTRTATNTATESHTASPAATPSITPTATGTRTVTQTATETATFTETRSPTYTPTATRTATETSTPSATRTDTPTPTNTRTMTDTPTFTNTQTETSTPTETPTITATASITPTPLPSPSDIDISLKAEGPIKPKIGDTVVLTITLTNNTDADVYGIAVRALLPPEVAYLGTDFLDAPVSITPTAAGTTLAWDISYKLGQTDPFILEPGQSEMITFSVKIIAATVNNDPIRITAETDYMDGFYFTGSPNGDRHPPLSTGDFFYPLGRIVVYPNPYNPVNGDLKFSNVVPGSTIQIWTLSGEFVRTIYAPTYRAFWDGRNHKAAEVSAGIYLFTIRNGTSPMPLKGKIFVIKQ